MNKEQYNPFALTDKTILITGASSGIGRATAIECAKLGARCAVCGRKEERLGETLAAMPAPADGEGHVTYVGDLTEAATIERIVSETPALNGLVLCAGALSTVLFATATHKKFDEIFNINFYAPVELLRLLVKKKKLALSASVVFVSSVGGVHTHSLGNGIYDASKSAIHSVMKTCARELASKKIRVNSVNPGMVNTPLIHTGALTEEDFEADKKKYPLGRYGEPEDVAHGIAYLLSDASAWVTGHALVIDGGITA